MLKKSRKQLLKDEGRSLYRRHGQFSARELAAHLVSVGWEPIETPLDLLTREVSATLKADKDDSEVRLWLSAKIEQQTLWAPRQMASYDMRQQFINDQIRRIRDDIEAIKQLVATMNSERRTGEPEFQLRFDFDF